MTERDQQAERDCCAVDERAGNAARDYLEIGGIFLILAALVFAFRHFDLLPRGFSVSDTMGYGLVFLIGLVASVSSCIAVTGGLLVALAAKYNEVTDTRPGLQRLKPLIYFNAGRIISYTLLGGAVGALGSVLTLSSEVTGILTIAASAVMILLGIHMLKLVPSAQPLAAENAEGFRAPDSRSVEEGRQGRRLCPRYIDVLPAMRIHTSASALCSRKGKFRRWRADHAGLFTRYFAGPSVVVGGIEFRARRIPETFSEGGGRGGHCAGIDEYPIRLRAHRQRSRRVAPERSPPIHRSGLPTASRSRSCASSASTTSPIGSR